MVENEDSTVNIDMIYVLVGGQVWSIWAINLLLNM